MEHVRKGYRASKAKSHLILYRIENNIVEIIRVLHEQMDIENRLLFICTLKRMKIATRLPQIR
jgi:plasmid stabilization system protein ParE